MRQHTEIETCTTPWIATARCGVRPAPPGGLALVQDFLNTRAQPDLLGDGQQAQQWADVAVQGWSDLRQARQPVLTLGDDDATHLRELRDIVDTTVGALPYLAESISAIGEFTFTTQGGMSWTPSGQGWRWLCSAILSEVVLSQETGTWHRMKKCRNPSCGIAFYDSTWDNAAVWHRPAGCSPGTRLAHRTH